MPREGIKSNELTEITVERAKVKLPIADMIDTRRNDMVDDPGQTQLVPE